MKKTDDDSKNTDNVMLKAYQAARFNYLEMKRARLAFAEPNAESENSIQVPAKRGY